LPTFTPEADYFFGNRVNNPAPSARNKRDLHESAIEALARETNTAIAVVKRLYELEITELKSNSTVKEFHRRDRQPAGKTTIVIRTPSLVN
jgi:hypothetical protein